jgi:hypothetical protein
MSDAAVYAGGVIGASLMSAAGAFFGGLASKNKKAPVVGAVLGAELAGLSLTRVYGRSSQPSSSSGVSGLPRAQRAQFVPRFP